MLQLQEDNARSRFLTVMIFLIHWTPIAYVALGLIIKDVNPLYGSKVIHKAQFVFAPPTLSYLNQPFMEDVTILVTNQLDFPLPNITCEALAIKRRLELSRSYLCAAPPKSVESTRTEQYCAFTVTNAMANSTSAGVATFTNMTVQASAIGSYEFVFLCYDACMGRKNALPQHCGFRPWDPDNSTGEVPKHGKGVDAAFAGTYTLRSEVSLQSTIRSISYLSTGVSLKAVAIDSSKVIDNLQIQAKDKSDKGVANKTCTVIVQSVDGGSLNYNPATGAASAASFGKVSGGAVGKLSQANAVASQVKKDKKSTSAVSSAASSPLDVSGLKYIPDLSPGKICLINDDPPLEAKTNSEGIATFNGLKIRAANNLNQYFTFQCESVFSKPIPLKLTTTLSSVSAAAVPTEVTSGSTFDAPIKVTVSPATAGKYCFVAIESFNGASANTYKTIQASQSGQMMALENAVSDVTDSSGVAVFSKLKFSIAGRSGKYALTFNCDGVKTPVTEAITVKTTVATLRLNWQPPARLMVPVRMKVFPTITVLDAKGKGIAGKAVSVVLTSPAASKAVKDKTTGKVTPSLRPAISYNSVVSDNTGLTSFNKFNVDIATKFNTKLVFDVDGVQVTTSQDIQLVPLHKISLKGLNTANPLSQTGIPGLPTKSTLLEYNSQLLDAAGDAAKMVNYFGSWCV